MRTPKELKKAKYTIAQFRLDYPNDAACLDKLFQLRFGNMKHCPKCKSPAQFRRVTTRTAYQCRVCYHQMYPTASTIFDKTRTPLTYWFYAMYLMTVTRNGVSAKELERQLGVTYKTAFRMAHLLRDLMKETDPEKLLGYVEIDEAIVGPNKGVRGRSKEKDVVFAMAQRLGNVIALKVDDAKKATVYPIIEENVDKSATVITDKFKVYDKLWELGYDHKTVNHSMKQYVIDDASTNTVEGFFGQLRRMIIGTHIHISTQHTQKYLDECAFRYNYRFKPSTMFDAMINNTLRLVPRTPRSPFD